METKKVLVLGIDGYIGWALSLSLLKDGHIVYGIDDLSTRRNTAFASEGSAFPLPEPKERKEILKQIGNLEEFEINDITKPEVLKNAIEKFKPDTIVHFAEQRAAPYSMINEETAIYTMENNVLGTMRLIYAVKDHPEIHILKMGTMGEYGTPNYDIPEAAYIDFTYKGRTDKMPVPKFAGSWYHWTKVHDTHNLLFANKVWGITVTDDNQGPVFGTRTLDMILSGNFESPEAQINENLRTRLDVGDAYGTVINKNIVRAIVSYENFKKTNEKMPLYNYGKAKQIRGFINLQDSVDALKTLIYNPPNQGEFRVVNQFYELLTTGEIIRKIRDYFEKTYGYRIPIATIEDPRTEKEEHYYNPEIKVLPSLGFKPRYKFDSLLPTMVEDFMKYKDRLMAYKDVVGETLTGWKNGRQYQKKIISIED